MSDFARSGQVVLAGRVAPEACDTLPSFMTVVVFPFSLFEQFIDKPQAWNRRNNKVFVLRAGQ